MSADAGAEPSRYLSGGLSEKGRRPSNEDAAALKVFPPSSALRAFAVLCDGMGGHNAGEVASRLAIETLTKKIEEFAAARTTPAPRTREQIEDEVRGWVAEANREIHQRGKSTAEHRGMGTTVALAMVLDDDRLVVANVGDSRIYLVSGLNVRQLSVDHTALAEQRRALGSDSVAPEDDAANPFAHALTRSLGQEKTVVPDVRSDVTLKAGDVVILTSDGVTDVLEAERFLTALETATSLQEGAEEIHRLAFEAGSKDNISVALVSRGMPSRLGLGKAVRVPGPEPFRSEGAGGLLVAGAASGPGEKAPSRRGTGRLVGITASAVALLLVALAVVVAARRGVSPQPSAVASSSPSASLAPVAEAPTPTPTVTTPPPPAQAQAPIERGPEPRSPARPSPRAVPPAAGEPSFRTPAVLSGLKPLEFPPTPTATHTPLPPTTTPTEPPAPASPGLLVPAAAPGTPGTPAPSPASPPAPTPVPAPAPTPGVSA